MKPYRILPLLAVVLLFGCKPSEAQIKQALDQANRCDTVDDCTLVGSKCPFGCYIYAHKDEAERMKTMIQGFEARCLYDCAGSAAVTCTGHKCVVSTQVQQGMPGAKGNIGAACVTNTDCSTPMSYLTRSACPYASMCLSGKCAVGCPQITPSAKPVVCAKDADCDCKGYAGGDVKRCACVKNSCVAVVD